jgi:non-homologous end joining protein Ku
VGQIVKGYEYEKGKFVILGEKDFQRVDLEATQTVDIQDFVDIDEIDPMYFYKPYYLEPQKAVTKRTCCCAKHWRTARRSASPRSSSKRGSILRA